MLHPTLTHLYGGGETPNWTEHLAAIEAFFEMVALSHSDAVPAEITIASDAATPTQGDHTVDTEGDAASDTLANLAVTNFEEGQELRIRAANAAHKVVVKHSAGGSGQIVLQDAADFSLDDEKKWLLLKRIGTNWIETMRWTGTEANVRARETVVSSDGQTAGVTHRGRTIVYTGTASRTCAISAAADLGDGWFCRFRNDMTNDAVLTVDPNSSESIDGATTLKLYPGDSAFVWCNGTAFRSAMLSRTRLFRKALTSADTVNAGDVGTLYEATSGTFSLAIAAVSGFKPGDWFMAKNGGSGTMTIDPNSSEQIDGATTVALAPGESCIVRCTGSAWETLFRVTTIPAGTAIWSSYSSRSDYVDLDQLIPYDNSKPRNDEGEELFSHTHTRPSNPSSSNLLLVTVTLQVGHDNDHPPVIGALFVGSETEARAASVFDPTEERTGMGVLQIQFRMTAGTTASVTFKVRAGVGTASRHAYLNGFNGGAILGGALVSSIHVTEFKA